MPSTAELTEKYIEEHPCIKDCLKKDIVNYSKLSRLISKELGIEKKTSIDAIQIACRRYAEKLKRGTTLEDKIMKILKGSELEIKNKVAVVVISKRIYPENLIEVEKKVRRNGDPFHLIEGTKAFTIVLPERYVGELSRLFKRSTIKVTKGLTLITIKSPEDIETTPGVVSYLYSLFGEHGINIVETMSCWTDTIFVVSEDDFPKAMRVLKF